MNYNLEIQKLLLKIKASSNTEDRLRLYKQAITIADANNDLERGFELRLDLIHDEKNTAHCIDSFPAFAWILNTYDTNPDVFKEEHFLWEYKWMASSARRNVNIPKDQVLSIMDDLKARMSKNGFTDRAYYSIVIDWYIFIGDISKARECLELRDKNLRDRMSHCLACELDTDVEIELISGNFDLAITKSHDLFSKKISCGVVPLCTYCNMCYYLTLGNDPRASEYFIKAEQELDDDCDLSRISSVSKLLFYLSKKDKVKAWEYFEKYAEWEVESEDSLSFYFAIGVLPLLKDDNSQKSLHFNHGHKLPYYREDHLYNVADLYNYYYKRASDLASGFDQRNMTNKFTTDLRAILE